MNKRYERALDFAHDAHAGQVRKYTGEPYVNHVVKVASLVAELCVDPGDDIIIAALLHDTIEDTGTTTGHIAAQFGFHVALLVEQVTDVSKPSDGPRRVRKRLDLEHIAKASPKAKTIKLADLIDNTASIVQHDPVFSKVYLAEKENLLEVLTEGNRELWLRAYMQLRQAQRYLAIFKNIPVAVSS